MAEGGTWMLRLAVCSGIQPRAHGTSHIHFGERESSTAPGLQVQRLGHTSWGLMETECPQSWSPLMGASGQRGQFLVMNSGPSPLNLSSIFKASSFNRLSWLLNFISYFEPIKDRVLISRHEG